MVADAGRLLAAHWPWLVLLAVLGVLGREAVLHLAVLAAPVSVVLSYLVLALAPVTQLLAVVGMLTVLRRRAPRSAGGAGWFTAVVTGTGAVLLPYLVVYEHYGDLDEDVITFSYAATLRNLDAVGASPVPVGASLPVVATVVVALLARQVLAGLAQRTSAGRAGRRAALRVAAGYCEAVWIVLGLYVVAAVLSGARGWWSGRRAAVGLADWWSGIAVAWPFATTAAEALVAALGVVLAAALVAVVVPFAWLAVTATVHGVEAAETIRSDDVASGRLGSAVVGRLGDRRTARALTLLLSPDRRFGTVLGAAALVLRGGWRPVLVFCLAFLVADNADLVLWQLARALVGPEPLGLWSGVYPLVDAAGLVAVRVLTLALVASAVDSLLRSLGLPGSLALRRSGPRPGETSGDGEHEGPGAEGGPPGPPARDPHLDRVDA